MFPDFATLVENTLSEGWEIELVGSFKKGWDVAVSVSDTQAIRDGLPGDEFKEVIDYIVGPDVDSSRADPDLVAVRPRHLYLAQSVFGRAGPGRKPSMEQISRKFANGRRVWSLTTVFETVRLKGVGLGVAWRYEDPQIYAYGLDLDDEGNTIVNLDETYKDDERHTFDILGDLFASGFRCCDLENTVKHLQCHLGKTNLCRLNRNPDGTNGLMGIREGMSWAIKNTFSF